MNHGTFCSGLSRRLFSTMVFCCALFALQPVWALPSGQSLLGAVRELATAPDARRAAFVAAAVTELSAAYRVAAQPSAKHRQRGQPAKSWNAGAQAYVARLQRAAAAARAGAAVQLLIDGGRNVRVIVGRRPARQFMISAPGARGRVALERAIVRRLCAQLACGARPSALASSAPAATAGTMAAALSHTPRAPPAPRLVQTLASGDDGLRCAPHEVRHQVLYDSACQALLGDVRALVKALHGSARSGVSIDWRMPARPYAKGAVYALAVNAHGDTVSMPLAVLADAPELLLDILPWAQARLYGRFETLALRPPARLVYRIALAQR